ncbi:hypothetical protein [Bifidobacterium sp. SO1]|uniref:hypothetical protein n=1 Tax=Bifidobacterium sp. SO1 TaxID=2809029 RepID=UPI001BDD8EF1|nr:hypothetical protein [Bifidobacterium sp. SO1]MBT1162113.1 hypothetical protein [Bifidobacterium sp. SO1]
MMIDLDGVPETDPQAELLRELDRLMGERYRLDAEARAELVPVLREYARLSRDLHRRLATIRSNEIDRFDRTVEEIGNETGIVSELPVEPDRTIGRDWELMDEIDSLELTLLGRAEDCELLVASISERQDTPLEPGEKRALHRRLLYEKLAEANQRCGQLRDEYGRRRRDLLHAGHDLDLNLQALTSLKQVAEDYRDARQKKERLERELKETEES